MTEHGRSPWWKVNAIFGSGDTDEGDDFAYTVGLASRGLPELHMWSRPVEGDDPGHDWRFSMRDMCTILNETAWRLIDRRVAPGDTWETAYDGGLVTARFRLDPPVEANSVEAFEADPAPVLPVPWSLHRAPVGPPTPMSREAQERAARDYAATRGHLPPHAGPAGPWQLPQVPRWDPEQTFGPRTPLVLVEAARIRTCDANVMSNLVDAAFVLEIRRLTSYPLVVARSAARRAGRSSALERLEHEVGSMVGDVGRTWAVDEWPAARAWLDGDDEPFPEDRLRELLGSLVVAHLATVLVEDELDDQHVVEGLGAVRAALGPRATPPDERWTAAPHVLAAVQAVVREAGAGPVVAAARGWADADVEEVADLRGTLAALMWRSPSAFPRFQDNLPRGIARKLVRELRGQGVPDWVLQDWLSTVAVVMSHRALLHGDDVDRLLRASGPFVPDLPRWVNEPLGE